MIEVVDVLKRDDFRNELVSAIRPYLSDYCLPVEIPPLYKYRGFSKYAVDNIVDEGVSLSLIGTFNDCYDSTISFGDIKQRAAEEFEKDCKICKDAGCKPCLTLDDWYEHIVTEQEPQKVIGLSEIQKHTYIPLNCNSKRIHSAATGSSGFE